MVRASASPAWVEETSPMLGVNGLFSSLPLDVLLVIVGFRSFIVSKYQAWNCHNNRSKAARVEE